MVPFFPSGPACYLLIILWGQCDYYSASGGRRIDLILLLNLLNQWYIYSRVGALIDTGPGVINGWCGRWLHLHLPCLCENKHCSHPELHWCWPILPSNEFTGILTYLKQKRNNFPSFSDGLVPRKHRMTILLRIHWVEDNSNITESISAVKSKSNLCSKIIIKQINWSRTVEAAVVCRKENLSLPSWECCPNISCSLRLPQHSCCVPQHCLTSYPATCQWTRLCRVHPLHQKTQFRHWMNPQKWLNWWSCPSAGAFQISISIRPPHFPCCGKLWNGYRL